MNQKTLIALVAVLIIGGGAYWTYATQYQPSSTRQESMTNEMGTTNSGENAEPGSIHNLPVEPAAAAARADLAAKLGVSESSIVIMLVEEKTWSDGCLGLGGPAESCLAALVDGFRVELEAKGQPYVYRTDKTGVTLRAETR